MMNAPYSLLLKAPMSATVFPWGGSLVGDDDDAGIHGLLEDGN